MTRILILLASFLVVGVAQATNQFPRPHAHALFDASGNVIGVDRKAL